MVCNNFLRVCSDEDSPIGLTAPSAGVYSMEFTYLGNLYQFSVTMEEDEEFLLPRDWNEDCVIELEIKQDNELIDFDGTTKHYVRIVQCFGSEVSNSGVSSTVFEYIFENASGDDFELDGVEIEDANVTLSYPGAGVRYRIVVFRAGARQKEGLHYTYNRTTGVISFTFTVSGEDLIIEFTQI